MAEAARLSQPRRVIGRWIALVGAMLLAGCQTIVPKTAPPPQTPPPQQTRPTGPVSPGLPQDMTRHRVALLVPLSGGNAAVGRSLANATQMALLDSQSEQVRITTYDTATGAAAAASRAIAEGAQMILGPLLAEDARIVGPIAQRAGVPVLSFSNDTSVAGGSVYVMGYSPAQSIERVVDYARRSGIGDFAGLTPKGLYGERASTALLRAVESAGGRVTGMQSYDRSAGSIQAAVGRLARSSPAQAVLIADSAGSAAIAAPLLRRTAAGVRFLGTELWNSDNGLGSATTLNGAWFASVSDALYRQYAMKYRARFNAAPYRLSTLGYDVVLLTVRIARDWPVGDHFPAERLADRGGFTGIDGAFRFNRDNVAERALEVQELRGGAVTVIDPAPSGFAGR